MAIILFSMNGCGFCQKAKQLLKKLIDAGMIEVKDAKDAPKGVRGFPFFLNTENNEQMTGYPGTIDNLMKKLGVEVGVGKSTSPVTPVGPGGLPPTGSEGMPCRSDEDAKKYGAKCNDGLICGVKGICVKKPTNTGYNPGLTSGDIAGIVIGSIAGVILLVLLGMMIFKKGKKGSKSKK